MNSQDKSGSLLPKLELKHIAPYFPYGLKGIVNNIERELVGYSYTSLQLSRKNGGTTMCKYDQFQPLLRNLADLTKEIEHNGERFVPIDRLKDIYNSIPDCFIQKLEYHNLHSQFTLFGLEENESYEVSIPLCIYQKLYEWHFAIDIPEHLYIDINTITNG